ncbi:MAG: site-specific integrase [Arcobacter sp.]|nr:site-specific integrase [Arcobacter sp.]
MRIDKRASSNAVIKQVMKQANGIGTSKTLSKNNSDIIGQNGHSVSSKAHSIKSIQNLRSITTQYVNFVKENYGNRVVNHLNNETMKDFINHKFDNGASEGTINTYISTLSKVSDNLNLLGVNSTSREEITAYRSELKDFGHHLQKNHINRAYENPQAIIREMNSFSPYTLSAKLQLEAGLRAGDSIEASKWILNLQDNTLTVQGSKNGLTYTTSPLSSETVEQVREAIQNNYSVNYGEYRETLKEAVETTGQSWKGTHGLRYNYAQEAISNGASKSELSLNLGHSRSEISDHYLIQ